MSEQQTVLRCHCPECNKRFKYFPNQGGKTMRCTACGTAFRLPGSPITAFSAKAPVEPAVGASAPRPLSRSRPDRRDATKSRLKPMHLIVGAAIFTVVFVAGISFMAVAMFRSPAPVDGKGQSGLVAEAPKKTTGKSNGPSQTTTETRLTSTATDSNATNPASASPASLLKMLAGDWIGEDISITLSADGRGSVELLTFSQGNGVFALEQNGQRVPLVTSFVVDTSKTSPTFSFDVTLASDPGDTILTIVPGELKYQNFKASSRYELAILPESTAEKLVVSEQGGRIRPNPMTLRRRTGETPTPAPAPAIAKASMTGDQIYRELLRSTVWIAANVKEAVSAPPVPPMAKTRTPLDNTVWTGSETLANYGKLRFEFLSNGAVDMVDTRGRVYGTFSMIGNQVTLRFYQTCVYTGTLNGDSLSGTATEKTLQWKWNVRKSGTLQPPPAGSPPPAPASTVAKSFGSGALIDVEDRLVVTNEHVVQEAKEVLVHFPKFTNANDVRSDRASYPDYEAIRARVVARHPKKDLAVLQLDSVPPGVRALTVAREKARPGQQVHSVGNPGASKALWVYSPGRVRQVFQDQWTVYQADRKREFAYDAVKIDTDSAINPGDSGGPLVDDKCELVGIAHGLDLKSRNFSHFIDASEIRTALKTVKNDMATSGASMPTTTPPVPTAAAPAIPMAEPPGGGLPSPADTVSGNLSIGQFRVVSTVQDPPKATFTAAIQSKGADKSLDIWVGIGDSTAIKKFAATLKGPINKRLGLLDVSTPSLMFGPLQKMDNVAGQAGVFRCEMEFRRMRLNADVAPMTIVAFDSSGGMVAVTMRINFRTGKLE